MRFEVLVPIWGERYVKDFCALGLRSILAPGNLPWLCADHDVTVTVLTTHASHEVIRAQPAFQRIEGMAKLSLIDIDDLIEAYGRQYAIILTRAYNRAMALSADLLDTSFIYLVGDLLFSDGAFQEIVAALESGCDACLMCSPRVDAEAVEPRLAGLGSDTELAFTPRQLAAYLMAFPHPTLAAKIVKDDQTIALSIAHQFFWRPRADTMVARCFLQHMICIRPTRRPIDIAAPCDYAFATELAPSGRWHYMQDSDRFLVLEMQGSAHEVEFIKTHPLDVDDVAEAVSFWSTAQHRAFSQAVFVYRSGDSDYTLDAARCLTDPFMNAVRERLPQPLDHRNHIFWLGSFGVQPVIKEVLPLQDAPAEAVPAVLAALIQADLQRRGGETLRLAVSVAAGSAQGVDAMLAPVADILIRAEPERFYAIMEDITGPGDTLLLVLQGNLKDFMGIFGQPGQLSRLLRIGGLQRTLILCFQIEPEALKSGEATRAKLHALYARSLGTVEHYGLRARVLDLSVSPFDDVYGFVIEIVADAMLWPAFAASRSGEDSLLFGQRGGEAVYATPGTASDIATAAAAPRTA